METGVTIFSIAYVIVLIVPGLIFKRFFFQGAFSGQFNTSLFADRVITSLFWGILVQIISIVSFSRIFNVSYQGVMSGIQGTYANLQKNTLPDLSATDLFYLFVYAIHSVVLAAVLGFSLFKTIRLLKLDLRFPAFRFLNQWHYYFRGEILLTKEFRPRSRRRVLSAEVDVVVGEGKDSNLFSGLLTQYTLSKQNELEALYLTSATRYSQSRRCTKAIPGDIFVIPYSTVHNLNIRYNYEVKKARRAGNTCLSFFLSSCLLFVWCIPGFFISACGESCSVSLCFSSPGCCFLLFLLSPMPGWHHFLQPPKP